MPHGAITAATPMNLRLDAFDGLAGTEAHFAAGETSGVANPYFSSRSKRALDVFGALLGLVLGAPFLVLIAIVIRATSPGPALFWQMRGGRGGVPFRLV